MWYLDALQFPMPMLGVIESIGAAASYALYASLVSAAVSGYISYDSGQTASEQAKYNAEAQSDAISQAQAEKAAEDAENRRRTAQEQRRFRAAQLAAMGGSGAMLGTGSPLAIEADTWAKQQTQLADQEYINQVGQRNLAFQRQNVLDMGNQQAAAARREGTGQAISGLASGLSTYQSWSTRPQRATSTRNAAGYTQAVPA